MSWFSDIGDAIGDAAKSVADTVADVTRDSTKAVIQTVVTPANVISGKDVVNLSYSTGLFNKVVKPLNNLGQDAMTVGVYNVVAPINSITGHEYDPNYKTDVGQVGGQIGEFGVNELHVLNKSIADGVTGGLATKLVNKIRSSDNQETAFGGYNESRNVFSDPGLSKIGGVVTDISTKVGTTFGALYGAKVVGGLVPVVGGAIGNAIDKNNNGSGVTNVQAGVPGVPLVMIVIGVVLLFFASKLRK